MKRKLKMISLIILLILTAVSSSCNHKSEQKIVVIPEFDEVDHLQVINGDNYVYISWFLPDDKDVSNIMVRKKLGTYPVADTDGEEFYNGELTKSVYDSAVSNGVTYFYRILTGDGTYFSNGVVVKATPEKPKDLTPPSDVTDVNSVAGNQIITISWLNPVDSDFAGVKVLKRDGSCPQTPDDGDNVYTGYGSFITDTNVQNFHTYCYVIFAFDDKFNYSFGVQVNSMPFDYTPPDKIVTFYGGATTNSVMLSWINPSNDDFSYVKIRRNGNDYYDSETTEESFIDKSVSSGLTYKYEAESCDIYDNCAFPVTKDIVVPFFADVTAPENISNLNIVSVNEGNGLLLSWNNSSDTDFVGVKLVVRKDRCPLAVTDGTVVYSGPSTEYIDKNCGDNKCVNNEEYCYRVFSYDPSLNYSSGVTAVGIPKDSLAPLPIFDLTGSSDNSGIVTLNWTNPQDDDIKGVEIFILDGACSKSEYTFSDLNSKLREYSFIYGEYNNYFIDNDPPKPGDNNNLCFVVLSKDEVPNLSSGPGITVLITDNRKPPRIVNLQHLSNNDGSVSFTWDFSNSQEAADIKGTLVMRKKAIDEFDNIFVDCDSNSQYVLTELSSPITTITDSTLQPSSFYNYSFCSYDEWGNLSLPYNIQVSSKDITPPSQVINTELFSAIDGNEIEINWELPNDSDLYGIKIIRKTGDFVTSPTDPAGTVIFDGIGIYAEDINLSNGVKYYYSIYSYDRTGNYSDPVTGQIIPYDINPPEQVGELYFSPSLTKSVINVSWVLPDVSDLAGVTVVKNSNGFPVNVNDGTVLADGKIDNLEISQNRGTLIYYSFFTSDEVPNYSKPVTKSFYMPGSITYVTGNNNGFPLDTAFDNNRIYSVYYSEELSRGVTVTAFNNLIPLWSTTLISYLKPEYIFTEMGFNNVWVNVLTDNKVFFYKVNINDGTKEFILSKKINSSYGDVVTCENSVKFILSDYGSNKIKIYSYFVSNSTLSEISLDYWGNYLVGNCSKDTLSILLSDYDTTKLLYEKNGYWNIKLLYNLPSYGLDLFSNTVTGIISNKLNDYMGSDGLFYSKITSVVIETKIADDGLFNSFEKSGKGIFSYKFSDNGLYYYLPGTTQWYSNKLTTETAFFVKGFYNSGNTVAVYHDFSSGSIDGLIYSGINWGNNTFVGGNKIIAYSMVSTNGEDYLFYYGNLGTSSVYSVSERNILKTVSGKQYDITSVNDKLAVLYGDNKGLFLSNTVSPYNSWNTIKVLSTSVTAGKMCYITPEVTSVAYIDNAGNLYLSEITESVTNKLNIDSSVKELSLSCSLNGNSLIYVKENSIGYSIVLYNINDGEKIELFNSLPKRPISPTSCMKKNNVNLLFTDNSSNRLKLIKFDATNNYDIISSEYITDGDVLPFLGNIDCNTEKIAFYDRKRGDLYFAYKVNGYWNYQPLDTFGDTGLYPSIKDEKINFLSNGVIFSVDIK